MSEAGQDRHGFIQAMRNYLIIQKKPNHNYDWAQTDYQFFVPNTVMKAGIWIN